MEVSHEEPVVAIEVAKEQLESLDYPSVRRFEHRNVHHLLSGLTWVLSATPVLDVYSRCQPVSTTVPPLPYSVLGQAFKDVFRPVHSHPRTVSESVSWEEVTQLAHSAQRMHGRIEMLQKQLQQELIRNAKLLSKLEVECDSADLRHTPYELVAANSEVVQSHIHDASSLCQELDERQKLSQLAPAFFAWACTAVSNDEATTAQQYQEPDPYTPLLPGHLISSDYEVSKLQEV
jgi:hypothetical protein